MTSSNGHFLLGVQEKLMSGRVLKGSLPSTASLRAFDAAARRMSFTDAAVDLSQTQGAISHQIRELENRLGVMLFVRLSRGIALSVAGQRYLPFARDALERMHAGDLAVRPRPNTDVLTVSCSPNFAHKWLVPRMGSFIEQHPTIDLRISASPRHIDFHTDDIDIAVRHGDGDWPDLAVTRLCEERLFPVCSPHLSPAVSSIRTPVDMNRYNLIHDQQRSGWAVWLKQIGADTDAFDLDRGLVVSQTSLAIDAAIATQGIALARSALVTLDLAAGRLVRPLSDELPAEFSYWIVCRKANQSETNSRLFTEWLLQQASGEHPD